MDSKVLISTRELLTRFGGNEEVKMEQRVVTSDEDASLLNTVSDPTGTNFTLRIRLTARP